MALNYFIQRYAKKSLLTERETEVFHLLVHRTVNPSEIGRQLEISLHTVNNHLKKILEKTRSDSKTELLADFLLFIENHKEQSEPKVLILDDETDLTQMLKEYLALKNIQAYVFNDPALALQEIRKLKIDIVISDIRMPKLNGVSFLQEIRKMHYYEPGLIFISGYPEEYSVDTLYHLGAYAFMEKPLNLDLLQRLIYEYVTGPFQSFTLTDTNAINLGEVALTSEQIGFGGLYLPLKRFQAQEQMQKGALFNVQFKLPSSQEKVQAICEIVWTRSEEEPGCGMKFVKISPTAHSCVLEHVRKNNIYSFIPKNSVAQSF